MLNFSLARSTNATAINFTGNNLFPVAKNLVRPTVIRAYGFAQGQSKNAVLIIEAVDLETVLHSASDYPYWGIFAVSQSSILTAGMPS